MKYFKGLVIFIAGMALAGCGGSGGGDDDDDNSAPSVEETPVVSQTVAPATVVDQSGTPAEPVTTNQIPPVGPIAPPVSTVSTPQDLTPTSSGGDIGALAELLGSPTIGWIFDGSEDIFATIPIFRSENVFFSDSGTPTVTDIAAGFGATLDGEEVIFAPERVTCAWLDAIYFCVLSVTTERETLFIFDPLINGESAGFVEFCAGSEDCVDDLFDSPDGEALLLGDTAATAKVGDGTRILDSTPYMAYAKQGVPHNTESVASRLGLDESDVERLSADISAIIAASKK